MSQNELSAQPSASEAEENPSVSENEEDRTPENLINSNQSGAKKCKARSIRMENAGCRNNVICKKIGF